MIDNLYQGYTVFKTAVDQGHKFFPNANGTLKLESYKLTDVIAPQAQFIFSAKDQFPQSYVVWLSDEEYESLKLYCEWCEHSALFIKK